LDRLSHAELSVGHIVAHLNGFGIEFLDFAAPVVWSLRYSHTFIQNKKALNFMKRFYFLLLCLATATAVSAQSHLLPSRPHVDSSLAPFFHGVAIG
jgi:hypothetical protein